MKNTQCEKISELISGFIDNELTQQQRQIVSVHIDTCKHCQKIYSELKELQNDVANLQYPELEEDSIKQLIQEPVSKGLAVVGWVILLCGAIGLFCWHLFTVWTDTNIHLSIKIFISLVELGLLVLLTSAFRQRLIAKQTDKYRNIQL